VTAVLVLRALGLGDALTAVPALRGLRRLYADRPLVLAGPESVGNWFVSLGVIDRVAPTSGLAGPAPGLGFGPHVAVNLHGRGPQSHRLLQAAAPSELIAFDSPAAGHRGGCRWSPDEHEVARWCRLVSWAGGSCDVTELRLPITAASDGAIVVHPGAASPARRWPVERWTEVIAELRADGHHVVLTGTEADLCRRLSTLSGAEDLSGRLAIHQLAERVASAALVLCGDTGVAHLATALGVRSVTLLGPVPPASWGPAIDLDRHTVLYHGTRPGDPHADRPDPALLQISVSEVLTAARAQLHGTRQPST
jgi:ADP-heptose:LPS heptosyltransferase